MKHLLLLLPLACALASSAQTATFSWASEGETTKLFGSGRIGVQEAAMRIADPSLSGYQITGVSIDVPTKDGCSVAEDASVFLTSKLATVPGDVVYQGDTKTGTLNAPDILSAPAKVVNHGTESAPVYRIDLDFDSPYTLTDEGVYIGYSLNVLSLKNYTAQYPFVLVDKPSANGAFWFHAQYCAVSTLIKFADWTDQHLANNGALAMRVHLSRAQSTDNALSISCPDFLYTPAGKEDTLSARIFNQGSSPVSSFAYSLSDGTAVFGSGTISLDSPLAAEPGSNAAVAIPFTAPSELGETDATLTVTEVNGQTNASATAPASVQLRVKPRVPHHRPLIEEYTGFWCKNCPMGYVAIHQLKDLFGEDEVMAIAIHSNDALTTLYPNWSPASVGYPSFVIDRDKTYSGNFEILPDLWQEYKRNYAPADIDVTIAWTDDTMQALRAEATLNFAEDHNPEDFTLAYALVEDNSYNDMFLQANEFFGTDKTGPYWDLFTKGGGYVKVPHDDVLAVYDGGAKGISGSFIEPIVADTPVKHSDVLSLERAVNVYTAGFNYGKNIIQKKANLRVLAVLFDKNGKIVNSNTSGYSAEAPVYDPTPTGVETVEAEMTPVKTEFFTLEGLRLSAAPAHGAYIVVNHFADGSQTTAKRLQ